MEIICGRKDEFAFCFQITNVDHERKEIWGGIELWIKGLRIGDINYFNSISLGYFDMAQKIIERKPPRFPFDSKIENEDILT